MAHADMLGHGQLVPLKPVLSCSTLPRPPVLRRFRASWLEQKEEEK